MRALAPLITLLMWNSLAVAASEMATGGNGATFMSDDLDDKLGIQPVVNRPAPGAPLAPAPVQALPTAQPAQQPRCVPSRPYKESTQFKIHVDQLNQKATITSPEFPNGFTFTVSTGGATRTQVDDLVTWAKVPKAESGVAPYCPQTNQIPNVAGGEENRPKLITAFEQEEFQGRRDCTEEEVRGRSTVFPGNTYKSGQFAAIMPNAVRFRGGQFFHRCPSGEYCKNLGQPVSGECVRVPGWQKPPEDLMQAIREKRVDMAAIAFKNNKYRDRDDNLVTRPEIEVSATIVAQIRKYGAIEVTMSEPPPMRNRGESAARYPYPTRAYCGPEDIAIAKRIQANGGGDSEGEWSFSKLFGGIFGGGSNNGSARPEPAKPSRPETPKEQRQRERQEREQDWRRGVFGT